MECTGQVGWGGGKLVGGEGGRGEVDARRTGGTASHTVPKRAAGQKFTSYSDK